MQMIEVNGVELAVDDQGAGLPVVLLHGFPEFSYSWRHQVPALVEAGYRVINYDQRGTGSSGAPDSVDAYSLKHLVGDLVGLLDSLYLHDVTLVAHDWGTIVAYSAAIQYPERISRVVSLTAPYRGACWGFPKMSVMREQLADRFGYILMFHDGDAAERGFSADPKGWLNAFYLGGARGRTFLTDDELDVYVDTFVKSGITGQLNWYRNIDRNAVEWGRKQNAQITQPTLVIASDRDPVLPLSLLDDMDRWVSDLEVKVIKDCGHWTQQEKPAEVNEALVSWLAMTDGR